MAIEKKGGRLSSSEVAADISSGEVARQVNRPRNLGIGRDEPHGPSQSDVQSDVRARAMGLQAFTQPEPAPPASPERAAPKAIEPDEVRNMKGKIEDLSSKVGKYETRAKNAEAELERARQQIEETRKQIEDAKAANDMQGYDPLQVAINRYKYDPTELQENPELRARARERGEALIEQANMVIQAMGPLNKRLDKFEAMIEAVSTASGLGVSRAALMDVISRDPELREFYEYKPAAAMKLAAKQLNEGSESRDSAPRSRDQVVDLAKYVESSSPSGSMGNPPPAASSPMEFWEQAGLMDREARRSWMEEQRKLGNIRLPGE